MRQGGRDGAPTVIHYTINDYGTGISGAFAVALALYHRNRTGEGQSVSGALSYTACTMQSPFFLDYEGHQRKETEGLQARGPSALSSLYKGGGRVALPPRCWTKRPVGGVDLSWGPSRTWQRTNDSQRLKPVRTTTRSLPLSWRLPSPKKTDPSGCRLCKL